MGGLRDEECTDSAEATGDNSEYLEVYVPASGPDGSTPEKFKNIWGMFWLIIFSIYSHYPQRR